MILFFSPGFLAENHAESTRDDTLPVEHCHKTFVSLTCFVFLNRLQYFLGKKDGLEQRRYNAETLKVTLEESY